MNSQQQRRYITLVLALVVSAIVSPTWAADVIVVPDSGGSFRVKDTAGTPNTRLQVTDSGSVYVPGLGSAGTVCFTTGGQLTPCTTAGLGTVTSVGLSLPNIFSLSGPPVTISGTLTATLASQAANAVFAAPNGISGTPSFRALVAADVPTLNQNTTGTAASAASFTGSLAGDVTGTQGATTYNNVVPANKGGAGSISGILKANGAGVVSAATSGTDFLTPTGDGSGLTNLPGANVYNVAQAATLAGSAVSTNWTANTTAPGQTFAGSYSTSTSWSTTARYVSLASNSSGTTIGTTAAPNDAIVTAAGQITGITFSFSAATSAATTFIVTLVVANTPSLMTCTVPVSSTTCGASTGGPITVAANDRLELRVVRSGGANLTATVTATGATAVTTATAGNDTNYVSLSSACVSASSSTCNVATIPSTSTLTNASLTFGANVPTGNTIRTTLFQNGSSSGLSCDIAAGANTCSITGSLALTAADTVEIQTSRTAGTSYFLTTATTALNTALATTLLPSPHIATGRVTAGGTTQIVDLGAAGFTSVSSYNCTVSSPTDSSIMVSPTTASTFTLTSITAATAYSYICVGN